MSSKAPATKRKFRSAWEEIDYLYHKVLYWFYSRQDRRQASFFAERLRPLVVSVDPSCQAILGASCRALPGELAGDLWSAIQAREREIHLIRQLLQSDAPPAAQLPPAELSDRLDLLAILYWHAGNLVPAREVLQDSQNWCAEKGIPFDGQELLDELDQELEATAANGVSATERR
jgi:hypothetical protein